MSDTEAPPGIVAELVAGVVAAAITLACVLPPVVHLVLGPLGPGIGGFVAGNRIGPGARGKVIIAAFSGGGVAGVLAAAAGLLYAFATKSELPPLLRDREMVYGLVAAASGYAAVVSFVGATIAVAMRDKKAAGAEDGRSDDGA